MAETRPVFLTDSQVPVYFNMGEIPTNIEILENFLRARELLYGDRKRKPIVLDVFGERVQGFLFKEGEKKIIITDGFMGVLDKNKSITHIMPFTLFYNR